MTSALTDLSFNVWYDPLATQWRAQARELPMNLTATAATPEAAIAAITHHVEDLLAFLNESPRSTGVITSLDWKQTMASARVTPNEVRGAIKKKSLATLKDSTQLERVARATFHTEHHLPGDYDARVCLDSYIAGDDLSDDGEASEILVEKACAVLRNKLDVADRYERESGYFIDGYKRGVNAALKADL